MYKIIILKVYKYAVMKPGMEKSRYTEFKKKCKNILYL